MRVLEFQAKRLFREYGIPTPAGVVLGRSQGAASLDFPAVLKAQVPVGGRGKAGAIRAVREEREAEAALADLRKLSVQGHPVRVILAEEQLKVERELYLALLIHRGQNAPMFLAAGAGGMDIEEIARRAPTHVVRRPVDLCLGPTEHAIRSMALRLGLGDHMDSFRAIARGMYKLFQDLDATLVEINPLGVVSDRLVALDAKLVLDEKASFRHSALVAQLRAEQADAVSSEGTLPTALAAKAGLTYVGLDGNIALVSDGAGTGMLTLDLIHDAGGRAASFCELGALANADGMQVALRAVAADPSVRVILVSLIGGLTRMDEIAQGISAFLGEASGAATIVVRMAGTREEEGRAILAAAGVAAHDDLPTAVRQAVNLSKEDRCRSS